MKKYGIIIVAGLFAAASIVPTAAFAGRGGGGAGQGNQIRQQSMDQTRTRLQDGSGLSGSQMKSGEAQKKGNTYGPGDGTGNKGDRPQDGTGYGAPTNR